MMTSQVGVHIVLNNVPDNDRKRNVFLENVHLASTLVIKNSTFANQDTNLTKSNLKKDEDTSSNFYFPKCLVLE